MAPPLASYDDPSSFLFGLNHFNSPGMASEGQGGHGGSGSGGSGSANNNNNGNGTQSLLAGLEAFGEGANNDSGNDPLGGGSFADELALWTNANFSFDGPTGHALIGDEEKEKDKDKDKDKDEEDRRAGKRVRNNNGNDNDRDTTGRSLARNGKNRLRDENSNDTPRVKAPEPTHQAHHDQALLQQQQHYFAPPSSRADEGRRPGYAQGVPSGVPSPSGLNGNVHAQPPHQAGQPQQQMPFPFSAPFNGAMPNHGPQGQHGAQQPPHQQPPQQQNGNGPVDLTSLLAIQQLIASNPLALATLGSFSGLNPQLGVLSSQLGQLGQMGGANNAQALQQLQQQLQQQQAQRGQHNGFPQGQPQAQVPPPQQQTHGPQNASPFGPSQYPFGGPQGPQQHGMMLPGYAGNTASLPYNGMISGPVDNSASFNGNAANAPTKKSNGHSHASSGDESGNDAKPKTSKWSADRDAEDREAAEREADNIPPLKLIDTGNPAADAEANRLAIEEDKRRRNTAASARFRVKKKQREAALEAHTKDLEDQVTDLREELEKLRNENQWLKGLIQVRAGPEPSGASGSSTGVMTGAPGSDKGHGLTAPAMANNNNAASQPLPSLTQQPQSEQDFGSASGSASSGHLSAAEDRSRHTGIHPRGVGTASASTVDASAPNGHNGDFSSAVNGAAGQKRDRSA